MATPRSGFPAGQFAAVHVLGAVEALPFAARKWIGDLHRDNAGLGVDMEFVFATEIGAELLQHLGGLDRQAIVFPGTAAQLTVENVGRLTSTRRVACILCDHLPDEGAEALPADVWTQFREVLFFPPWTACLQQWKGRGPARGGRALIAYAAGDPPWNIAVRSGREGPAHAAPWEMILETLESQQVVERVDMGKLEAMAGQPAGLSGVRVIAVASDRVEIVLRGAIAAWRLGLPFLDWAARISPMRLSLEGAAPWCVPGEAMPWSGIRKAVQRLLSEGLPVDESRRVARGHADGWIAALKKCLIVDTRTVGMETSVFALNEALRASARAAHSSAGAWAEFLWREVVESAAIAAEWLNGAALDQLAEFVVRRHLELLPQFNRAVAREDRLVGLFERVTDRHPEIGWVGLPLFHGLCDGHLIGWRRGAAQRALAMTHRTKRPPDWLLVQRPALALTLGQVKEFSDQWRDVSDHGTRVGALWSVLRAWMPIIDAEAQPPVSDAAATVWLRVVEEMLASPAADAATLHMATMGELYLRRPDVADDVVLRMAERGLNLAQVAALVILAWMRRRDTLAVELWSTHCRGQRPAVLRELAPVAIARALVTRDEEAGVWLQQVEEEDPAFFDAVVPSNTRCFFFALAWQALGDELRASAWSVRAEATDPSAALRRGILARAASRSTSETI